MSLYENIKNNLKETGKRPVSWDNQWLPFDRDDYKEIRDDNYHVLYKGNENSANGIKFRGNKGSTNVVTRYRKPNGKISWVDTNFAGDPSEEDLKKFGNSLNKRGWRETKRRINKGESLDDDIKEADYGYDYWGSKEMTPFSGPAYIEYYGGPGHLEYVYKSGNGRYRFMDFSNGDPYVFDSYKDALKVQQKLGGEILSYDRDYLGKDLEEAEEENKIINPNDEQYYNRLYEVDLWNGSGYSVDTFKVYAGYEEEALDKVVAYCEDNSMSGLIYTVDEIEKMVEEDYWDEYQSFKKERPDGDMYEFITNDLNYIYVDATQEGASQPYFVLGENANIKEIN